MVASWINFDVDFETGLAAGALSALSVWVVGRLCVHALLPRVRRWLYRGVNISGDWKGLGTGCTPAQGEWSELVIRLQQDIHNVRGVVTLRCRSAGYAFDTKLHAIGTVTEDYVALSLLPADESLSSPATALLKLEVGGKTLNGQLLYRHPLLDIVDVIDMSVQRAPTRGAPQVRTAPIATAPSFVDISPIPAGRVLE